MSDDEKPALTVHGLFVERQQIEAGKLAAEQAATRHAAEELARQRKAFEARPLTAADRREIQDHIRAAFDAGEKSLQVVTFPSGFCPDEGRHINHALPGWEDELPGYARRVYEFWDEALRPGGFGFNARVISYPNGMPGDIGLFITWPEADG
ncbi:hypothetical protein NON00_05595 [Roseomonas sp. GC11]|uniref:hypothetical protein n=1 Tax=Roseomonas sp. GC11 TaxID=2950546 RepID=UPI00210A6F3A|nr:hypothetical protein [Roseomonas sp. GC11]MCQ4159395.1 hypothetical protein [Roseomonas sp. GC11]